MIYSDLKIGIIGCGRWGINHVKTACTILNPENILVFDENPHAKIKVLEISSAISFTNDIKDILNNKNITGVIIATPAEMHFEISKECLNHGKHVLVEKPITLRNQDAEQLINISKSNNLKLMVGHVLLYHPAIVKIKSLIKKEKIGKLQYLYSNRLNLGALRSEENVLWSFAPHDISIIQYFTEMKPISVISRGAYFLQKNIEDTTLTYLEYPNNIHAHIFVSWLHPFKEHRLVIVGDKGMLAFDDGLTKEKLKCYPKGFIKNGLSFEKFDGEYEIISFSDNKPLSEEHKHFYECILQGKHPLTDGEHALEVLQILEQATIGLKYGKSN